MNHQFTATIVEILDRHFGGVGEDILAASPLLQYLNVKTRAANRGSKSRGSFANHYALYVLVEDYINVPEVRTCHVRCNPTAKHETAAELTERLLLGIAKFPCYCCPAVQYLCVRCKIIEMLQGVVE